MTTDHRPFWALLAFVTGLLLVAEHHLWFGRPRHAYDFEAPLFGFVALLLWVIVAQFLVILRLTGWL